MKVLQWIIGVGFFFVAGFYAISSYVDQAQEGMAPTLPMPYPNGEYFGFVHALTDNNASLYFDDAVWLSGVEGQDAAIVAGLCTEETRDECLSNDFFIKNTIEKDERILVDPNALIVMQTWGMEETGKVSAREIGLADFADLINDSTLHWRFLPYHITVTNGSATRIEEVYVP